MKRRIMPIVTICIVLAAGIFGFVKKQTYTDITSEENYLDSLQAALLSEQMAGNACQMLEEKVEAAPIILKGKPTGKAEHLFSTGRQKIKITQVYKGDGLQTGDEIYVSSDRWQLCLEEELKTVERGFVNVMKEDKEYLVFLSGQVEAHDTDVPVYRFYKPSDMNESDELPAPEFIIVPMFCYENMEHSIPELNNDDGNTYVPYPEVKDNEFFGMSEHSFEVWEQLKERLFAEYK